jgi:hypothetical protein
MRESKTVQAIFAAPFPRAAAIVPVAFVAAFTPFMNEHRGALWPSLSDGYHDGNDRIRFLRRDAWRRARSYFTFPLEIGLMYV